MTKPSNLVHGKVSTVLIYHYYCGDVHDITRTEARKRLSLQAATARDSRRRISLGVAPAMDPVTSQFHSLDYESLGTSWSFMPSAGMYCTWH